MLLYAILSNLVLAASAQTSGDDTVQVIILNDTYTWSSESPYPPNNQSVIVESEEGYRIRVTVAECDISGEDGDFLLIKAGRSPDDSGSGRTFTYNLKSPREYLVDSNVAFLSFQVFGSNEKQKSGAVVVFERFGEQTVTSTEPSVSTTVWPEHSANDSIYYDVAITSTAGIDLYDNATINDIKWAISQMAVAFCEEEVILLAESITKDNVLMEEVRTCPFYWPNKNSCIWINFSLPIVLQENQTDWTGYQLTTENLERMWNMHAEEYLNLAGFAPYKKADDDFVMLTWTLIICGVTVVFAAILFAMRYLMISLTRKDKREFNDTDSIVSKHRDSDLSLDPHPLQSIPQLFENDYPMYEPGMLPAPAGYENPAMSDDDSEDEIINTHTLNLATSTRLQESES